MVHSLPVQSTIQTRLKLAIQAFYDISIQQYMLLLCRSSAVRVRSFGRRVCTRISIREWHHWLPQFSIGLLSSHTTFYRNKYHQHSKQHTKYINSLNFTFGVLFRRRHTHKCVVVGALMCILFNVTADASCNLFVNKILANDENKQKTRQN